MCTLPLKKTITLKNNQKSSDFHVILSWLWLHPSYKWSFQRSRVQIVPWLVYLTDIAIPPKADVSCETDCPPCKQTPERCLLKAGNNVFFTYIVWLWHWSSASSLSPAGTDLSNMGSLNICYGRLHLRSHHFKIYPLFYFTNWSRFLFCGKDRVRALPLYWLSAFTQHHIQEL